MAHVIVVGGGISGLSAAYFLDRAGCRVTLVERDARLGGLLRTDRIDDCAIEAGPDSFLAAKPAALELIRELGIEGEVIPSNDSQRRTYIWRGGRLIPMPAGMVMMVPTDMAALSASSLISPRGRLEAAREALRSKPTEPLPERSVADFVRDHYGQEFVDYLAEPLLTGVYGGSAGKLSVNAVLPRFVDLEMKYGSVTRGIIEERKQSNEPLFLSLRHGMQQLIDALLGRLHHIDRVQGEAEKVADGWRVSVSGRWLSADAVILAVRSWQAAPLIADIDPELSAQLESIEHSSAVTVGFTYDAGTFPHPRDGFGFLVPAIERRSIVACTWVDRKFEHRAPRDRVILRSFLSGDGWASDASDEEITSAVQDDLGHCMGVEQRPRGMSISRWPRSMPQYALGHGAKVEQIRTRVNSRAGLYLAGNAYDGVGIPDCIRIAKDIASNVLQK